RRIGLVMEVARTSMIHAAAPHFLWPFDVRCAAHQLNLWPRVSLPETSPTLRWTREVGNASVFRVWGSRAFVRDPCADKLSPRAIPCVFLGFVPDAPGWQFYHPTLRRVFPSQDVLFDESVPFYRLFPYRSSPPLPPPFFLAPSPPPVDPLPPQGPSPSGVSQVDPLPGPAPVQVAVGSGAARGAASRGAKSGGAESEGAETGGAEPGGVGTGGAEPEGVEPGGAAWEGAESGGAEYQCAASSGGSAGASARLSPQQLREWFVRRARLRSGALGAGGAGGTGVVAGAGGTGGAAATGPGGARTQGTGAAGTSGVEGAGAGDLTKSDAPGAGGAGAGGAGVGGTGAGGVGAAGAGVGGTGAAGTRAVDPGAGGAGGTVRPRPYFVPLLQQSQPPLQPASPLPAPSPYTEQSGDLTERHEPASHPVSPVRTACHTPHSRPPPVPGTHTMTLRPSSVPLRVPLPAPPASSLPEVLDPVSECARAASPTISRLLATAVTDPSFESAAASALVAELLDFAAAYRLDYTTALVAESFSALASSSPRHNPLLCLPATCSQLHLRTSPTSGMGLVLGGRGPVILTGHADASWSTHSSSVLSSSCEAEIYAGAMAAQELRWLTYLLTDLGEQPRSPPVLYVGKKAMIALCQEHRLEHRTKCQRSTGDPRLILGKGYKHSEGLGFESQCVHFGHPSARGVSELSGQLRLAYVATRANTADVFTKALPPACFAFLDWSFTKVAVLSSGHLGKSHCTSSAVLPSHPTLLWHHRLGHPSLLRLRGMYSRLLVSGLPRSLPPLPPSPAPPCLPYVEGRQRAAPHSSSFPPTTSPLQTLFMDVWGPARVSEQSRERYFLLVVDDYTRYTTVFPLRSKGQIVDVLIPWIRTVHLQLHEHFGQDLPVLRLHSNRGAPHWLSHGGRSYLHDPCGRSLFSVAVCGPVGNASVFRVWRSRAFVRDTSADKLSPRAIPCIFLGFVPDAPGWQFYHPTSRRVFPSQDVTFDESVPFYRLFPYRSAPSPPPPLFLAPGPPPVDPLPPQGPAPSGVSQVDPLPGHAPVKVAVDSGAARGAASGGAESEGAKTGGAEPGGAEPGGVERGGAEPEGVEPGGAASEGAESGGTGPQGAASSRCLAGASPRLSSQQLRKWFVPRTRLRSGASGAGVAGDGAGGAGLGGPGAGFYGVGGPGVGGVGAGGAGAVAPGGTVRPRPYFVPVLQQVLDTPPSAAPTPPLRCPSPDQSQPPLQPASTLPAPSPYTEQSGGLTERREPVSRPASPVHTARCVPRSRPPPVPGTHAMTLHPYSVPLRVPLPAPPESSLPEVPDPESDRACPASPIVSRLLATAVTDPVFELRLALVAEFASASPPFVGGECALGTDVLEDTQEDFEYLAAAVPRFASLLLAPQGDPDAPDIPTPRSYAEAITGPYSSQWQAAMEAEMASWKSTGTYVDEVPPPWAIIVDGMWIFRVKRPPGSPPAFKARYVARGFSQRQGVDYFQTFSPTPKMTTLWVLLHVAAQRDYGLHSLDFSTTFLQGNLHKEIWTTLAALGFAPATADPSLFLRTDTSLPPFYVLVYVDDLVFVTANIDALTLVKSELQKRHTCTDLGPSALRLLVLLATAHSSVFQRLALNSTFERVLRRACGSCLEDGVQMSSPVTQTLPGSSCEAEIYAGAMAAQELCWLTYLLTDLGKQPRSPPVLTKHIVLRYFLARDLQQRGQLRLAYVATRANTANIFTKALPPGDHRRFSTVLGLVPTLPHLLTA
ncbi:unnamed protein product, partial [Closterium sp. NIES-53]